MVKAKKYFCQKCPAKYAHKYLLDIHLVSHGGASMFPCSYCDWDFFNELALRTHSTTDHPNQPVIVIERNLSDDSPTNVSESQSDRSWAQRASNLEGLDKSIFKPINWLALAVKQEQEEGGNKSDGTFTAEAASSSSSTDIIIKQEPLDEQEVTNGDVKPKLELKDLSTIIQKRFKELKTNNPLLSLSFSTEPLPPEERAELLRRMLVNKKKSRTNSDNKDFLCLFCDRNCKTRRQLKEHLELHNEKVYSCDICGVRFPKLGGLRDHSLMHVESKTFTCDLCEKTFCTMPGLRQHKLSYHQKKHVCHVCGISYASAGALRKHMRKHNSEVNLKCHLCKVKQLSQASLEIHLQRHKMAKYSCDDCGKFFDRKIDWKNHVKSGDDCIEEDDEEADDLTDEDEEDDDETEISGNEDDAIDLWCIQCEKEFDTSDLYEEHMEFHSTHPFACMECGEQTLNSTAYKKHLLGHRDSMI